MIYYLCFWYKSIFFILSQLACNRNIIIPTMEFGSMHCVLFNLAIVPFTMARYSIASFATSFLNDYSPLDKTQQIHNYLGYLTTGIISTSSVTFFVQFGLQCSHGVQSGCDMFTSEIMITGYITLVLIVSTPHSNNIAL